MRAAWRQCASTVVLVAACTQDLRVLDRAPEAIANGPSCLCEEPDLCAVDKCVDPFGITDFAVGYRHVCRVGDGELACWGDNAAGQLGLSDNSSLRDVPERVGDGNSWLQVSAAEEHTCAIAAPGRLYCWGNNRSGQLGTKTSASQRLPARVPDFDDFEQVFCGGASTCALRDHGALYCWGASGQLIAGTGDVSTPEIVAQPIAVVPPARFKDVSLGAMHTCAVRDDGALLCWGDNGEGQLGIGMTSHTARQPTQVEHMGWQQVSAGQHHTCGIRRGELYCWGGDESLELGTGVRRARSPARVGEDDDWASVSTGMAHTCARKRNSRLYCWGRNFVGQLGYAASAPNGTPTQVMRDSRFTRVAVGSQHSCALSTLQTMFCWGANDRGQLGVDDTLPHSTPTMLE